jgi:hypothetical protein
VSSQVDGSLKAQVTYEHRKHGKLLSKGYSFGDWTGKVYLVQTMPGMKMEENIFDSSGALIKSLSYRGVRFIMRKITHAIIKQRV